MTTPKTPRLSYAGTPFGQSTAAVLPEHNLRATPVLAGQDSVSVTAMSGGLSVYCGYEAGTAGYANGGYTTMPQVYSVFPGKLYLSVGRDAIDIEPGLATAGQGPGFVNGWVPDHTNKPVLYADAADMPSVIAALNNAGIPRSKYYLWVAQWDGDPTIPAGYDAKQYASNNSFDSNSFASYMFGPAGLTFPYKQGDAGTQIKTMQENLVKWKFASAVPSQYAIDGNFGPATAHAVILAQQFFGEHGVPGGDCTQNTFNNLAAAPTTTFPPVTSLSITPTSTGMHVSFSAVQPNAVFEVAVCEGTKPGPVINLYPKYVNATGAASYNLPFTDLVPGTQYWVGVRAAAIDKTHSSGWATQVIKTLPKA